MVRKLNSLIMSRFDNMLIGRKFTAISCFQKATLFLCVLLMSTLTSFSQDEGVKPPVVSEYKGDTTFANFHTLRFERRPDVSLFCQLSRRRRDGSDDPVDVSNGSIMASQCTAHS